MANNLGKIVIGKADISISDYVTAGGAGTFTDIGYTKGPCTIEPNITDYKIVPEQVLGVLRSIPVSMDYKLKFSMMETDLPKLRRVLRLPAANLVVTGTTPNITETLSVGDSVETYNQLKVITSGAKRAIQDAVVTRTYTFWKATCESIEPIGHTKEQEAVCGVTFSLTLDDSVATADKYFKVADTPLV